MDQEKKQFVNLIFFIRYIEPRDPQLDLLDTFRRQIELVRKYGFPATFLMEYDSLISPAYQELLKSLPENCEVGGWFEVVQPLVEKAGLTWRGRPGYPWDWHANVGFSVGYTREERKRLTDVYMEDYRSILGTYPKSVGSWLIDAFTLDYMQQKYGVEASCNCRDQWGTDGYTLWGGYYGQGYYPSRRNVFCPAQTAENQIPVPVFRMLGSDPIYQYDFGLQQSGSLLPSEDQGVVTLEPVYNENGAGGSSREWVSWFFKENFCPDTLSFNYVQAGQENSFGWDLMKEGLAIQFEQLCQLQKENKVTLITLEDLGKWYRETYPLTAASSMTALTDWRNQEHQTAWYNGRFYRANIYRERGRIWIRDIHLFREAYEERYLYNPCPGKSMWYDNLPLVDGNRWSRGTTRAGLYFVLRDQAGKEKELSVLDFRVSYPDNNTLRAEIVGTDGELIVSCMERKLVFTYTGPETLLLKLRAGAEKLPFEALDNEKWRLCHENFRYMVTLEGCSSIQRENSEEISIQTKENRLILNMDCLETEEV